MPLKRITLRIARSPDYPNGDATRGYVVVMPLDDHMRLDLDEWRTVREKCTVRRFSPDDDEIADGVLTHRGSHWKFHYNEDDEGDDDEAYRLGDHTFCAGDYVTITHEGEAHTFVVTENADMH